VSSDKLGIVFERVRLRGDINSEVIALEEAERGEGCVDEGGEVGRCLGESV
jgi:hypothetical protein